MRQDLAKWRSAVRIGLLAVFILIYVILHSTFLRIAGAVMGLRPDVPQIVLVEDNCGVQYAPPYALRSAAGGAVFHSFCDSDRLNLWYTVPSNGRTALFQNEALIATGTFADDRLKKTVLRLRDGVNRLTVLAEGQSAHLPYAALEAGPSYLLPQDEEPVHGARRTGPLDTMWVVHRGGREVDRLLGNAQDSKGDNYAVWLMSDCGLIDASGARAACRAKATSRGVGVTGYGVTPGTSGESARAVLDLRRELTITVAGQNLEFEADVCLANPLPLATLFKKNRTDVLAPELLRRVFGLQLPSEKVFRIHEWSHSGIARGTNTNGCFGLKSRVVLPQVPLLFESGNFLTMAGDSLTIENAPLLLETRGLLPEPRSAPYRLQWVGDYGQASEKLEIPSWPTQPHGSGDAAGVEGNDATKQDDQSVTEDNFLPTLLSLLTGVLSDVPPPVGALLQGLAAGLPVLVIAFAAVRGLEGRMRIVVPPILALASFVVAMAAQPIMLTGARLALSVFRPLREVLGNDLAIGPNEYAPLAVLAIMLMPPIARHGFGHGSRQRRKRREQIGIALGAVVFFGLAAAMIFALGHAASLEQLRGFQEYGTFAPPLLIWVVAWFMLSFIVVKWVIRALLDDTLAERAAHRIAWMGAAVTVFLPAVSLFSGALSLSAAMAEEKINHPVFSDIGSPHVYELASRILPPLAMVAILALVLHSFAEILWRSVAVPCRRARLSDRGELGYAESDLHQDAVMRWVDLAYPSAMASVLVAGVMVVPAVVPLDLGQLDFGASIYQMLGLFHDFAVLVALAIPIALLYWESHRLPEEDRFAPNESFEALLVATLAGYIALLSWNNLSFVISLLAVVAAWFGLRRLALRPPELGMPLWLGGTLKPRALLEAIETSQLLAQRGATEQSRYASGDIDWTTYREQSSSLDKIRGNLYEELGADPSSAKALLLNNGPLERPFDNALLGAIAGLLFSLAFDTLRALGADARELGMSSWWQWLLSGVDATAGGSLMTNETALLAQFQIILRGALFWPVLGLVFGALFHRLRGDDGFSKAAVMAATLVVPVSLSVLWSSGEAQIGQAVLQSLMGQLLSIALFLILLGTLVFDIPTICRRGLAPLDIHRIYGLRTVISYAGIVAAITALQSLGGLIGLLNGD